MLGYPATAHVTRLIMLGCLTTPYATRLKHAWLPDHSPGDASQMLGCPTTAHVTHLKHAWLRLITARVKEFGTSQTLPRHRGRPFPLFLVKQLFGTDQTLLETDPGEAPPL